MTPLKFVDLHSPLFFAGKSWGNKLDPGHRAGLELFYDRDNKELIVKFGDKECFLPYSSVQSMEAGEPEKRAVQHTHPIVAGLAGAQVETPYGHVHAGLGHGKTGKSK